MGTNSMENNLEAIMKVMRLATRRGKSRINLKEIIEPAINGSRTVCPEKVCPGTVCPETVCPGAVCPQ